MIDDRLKLCHQVSVSFDEELKEYKTRGGVYKSEDGSNVVTAPVNMWLKALDLCLDKLKIDGLDFSTVMAVSGSAQQHGSVWWRRESGNVLANLDPDEYLHKALVSAFTLRESPIWMDSSTTDECKMLEQLAGGAAKLAEITGSRAYERFTGAQIAKVFRRRPEIYSATERITLVSNFLASIMCGSFAPLDASDASGMNMMDITSKRWSDECLLAVLGGESSELAGLKARLGCTDSNIGENIVDTHEVVGRIAKYFIERHGFPPECLVSAFTGDNPGSMAGLCVEKDEVVVSLGTSDTVFFWLEQPIPGLNGHVLRNPLDENQYMGMVCFKNGSITRERIRDQYASGSWEEFSQLLDLVPRGNFGNIGFYYDLREIYPLCMGDFRFNKLDQRVDSFSKESEVRACLEGQFMRLYHHSQMLGLNMEKINRVLVTGGASANRAIIQVVADVFKLPVYSLDIPNSACLGAAYLAKYAFELEQQKLDQSFEKTPDLSQERPVNFADMIRGSDESDKNLVKLADPTPVGSVDAYDQLLKRYVYLEEQMHLNNDPGALENN